MLVQVLGDHHALLNVGGILRLRRQVVVDAHDNRARFLGENAAHAIVGVRAAHNKTAAVNELDHGKLLGFDGVIVASHEFAHGTFERALDGLGHNRTALVPEAALAHVVLAHLGESHVGDEGVACKLGRLLEDGFHLIVHEQLRIDFVFHVQSFLDDLGKWRGVWRRLSTRPADSLVVRDLWGRSALCGPAAKVLKS